MITQEEASPDDRSHRKHVDEGLQLFDRRVALAFVAKARTIGKRMSVDARRAIGFANQPARAAGRDEARPRRAFAAIEGRGEAELHLHAARSKTGAARRDPSLEVAAVHEPA